MANEREQHLSTLCALQAPTGLFLASAKEVSTGYNKAWLRDNFYTALAFEAVNEWEPVLRTYHALLDVLKKHEHKIEWAAQHKPFATWQYIHARYNPETFEEFWEEWGNKQNDAVGALLFKIGELEAQGKQVIRDADDRRLVQHLVDYVGSIEYWQDPDSGMWEEWEELHASSVGAVLAGLESVARVSGIVVPQEYIVRGGATLLALLPRESRDKFADLAQLSLIWPYHIVSDEQAGAILRNLHYHLERDRGLIRYKGDRYYNANEDGWSEEAEWTFGFSWLAKVYVERGDRERARHYLARARETVLPSGLIPELYYSNSPRANENTPLAWSESMFVVALAALPE